jgi:hypothetical protein
MKVGKNFTLLVLQKIRNSWSGTKPFTQNMPNKE